MINTACLYDFIEKRKEVSIPEIADEFHVSDSVAGKSVRYLRRAGQVSSKNKGTRKFFFVSQDKSFQSKRITLDDFLKINDGAYND